MMPSSEQLPKEHIGYGPWLRAADNQLIERHLDIRELTFENQRLFHDAALKGAKHYTRSPEEDGWQSLLDLGEMLMRADHGEPPLRRSDWRVVVSSKRRHIGPGWQV